jgi:hypothetical protein
MILDTEHPFMVQVRGLLNGGSSVCLFVFNSKCVGVKHLTYSRCEDMSLCIICSIDHQFLRLEAACVPRLIISCMKLSEIDQK